jgi:hypothetical protein
VSETKTPPPPIREPEFAKRLAQAIEAHPRAPKLGSGRLTWLKRELDLRGHDIQIETVRKWLAGISKARPTKVDALAEILGVDVVWLSLGIDTVLDDRQRKAHSFVANGALNVVAGLIQMDGGSPAFSDGEGPVDIHAIIKGVKYDLHVAVGRVSGNQITFGVPVSATPLIYLGLLKSGFTLDIFELPTELVASGVRHGTSVELKTSLEALNPHRIESFANRL